ncbi:MAG: zf-TFIIB domain-containing protein [Acidobacteriota bacterium]
MDCINCAAPLPAKTIRCPFCQTLNDIDLRGRFTVSRGSTLRDCPRCRQNLQAVHLSIGAETVELDRCPECRGIFFDSGEVEGLLDSLETRPEVIDHRQLLTLVEQEAPAEDPGDISYRPCPECGQLMHRRSFGQRSGVIVDCCREHGLWLDGGELRQLIRWTQAGGRHHDAQQKAEKAKLEAKLREIPAVPPQLDTHRDRFERPFGAGGIDAFDLLRGLLAVSRWLGRRV